MAKMKQRNPYLDIHAQVRQIFNVFDSSLLPLTHDPHLDGVELEGQLFALLDKVSSELKALIHREDRQFTKSPIKSFYEDDASLQVWCQRLCRAMSGSIEIATSSNGSTCNGPEHLSVAHQTLCDIEACVEHFTREDDVED